MTTLFSGPAVFLYGALERRRSRRDARAYRPEFSTACLAMAATFLQLIFPVFV